MTSHSHASRRHLVPLGMFCALALTVVLPSNASAQAADNPPKTLDQQLRLQLGLGDANGCRLLLGLGQNDSGADVDAKLKLLGNQIGNELRAICGPSAVTSASSLGGGLDTLQATKTATQFKLARRRIDQRVSPRPASGDRPSTPGFSLSPLFLGSGATAFQFADESASGRAGVFGDATFEKRTRAATDYEAPYESNVKRVAVGVDYLSGRTLFGAWFAAAKENADFTRFSPLVAGTNAASFQSVLEAPGALTTVCGGLTTGGVFDASAKTFGGFVGGAIGTSGFADAAFSMTRRANHYARSVCLIEAQPSADFKLVNGVLSSSAGVVDDIFAGTLSGTHDITELSGSLRLGSNIETDTLLIGPRASISIARGSTAPFSETGRSTVANTVVSNFGDTISRTLGGPIGIELAFDEQRQTSALLEAGAEVAGRAGRLVPFASAYLRHEFLDGIPTVTAHFVQDRRSTPQPFSFGHDAPDRDSLLLGGGVAFPAGNRSAVRVEVTKLAFDAIYSAFSLSVQARVQF